MVPARVWMTGYMLADRMRHQRQSPEPSEPLRQRVESSIAQVEHQIWRLRDILWWYLRPPALSIMAFFGQVAWQARSGGWWTALVVGGVVVVEVRVFAGVYWLNQDAVRSELVPRSQELEALLMSLKEETPYTVTVKSLQGLT